MTKPTGRKLDIDERLERIEKALMTLTAWICQSSIGVLSMDDYHNLYKTLKGEKVTENEL